MVLLFFITRLWPIVFLAVFLLFICVIRLLFLKPKPVTEEPAPPPAEPEKPDTEPDIVRRAFGLIQKRITECLVASYPDARWVWSRPNAMSLISEGKPVFILLNRAGGYRKAEVIISQLQFKTLRFETVAKDLPEAPTTPEAPTPPEEEPGEVNYGLLAFEWVEANSLKLNRLCNDSIARKENNLLIPADNLPVAESWQDLCDELIHNGFVEAEITGDGLRILHCKKQN